MAASKFRLIPNRINVLEGDRELAHRPNRPGHCVRRVIPIEGAIRTMRNGKQWIFIVLLASVFGSRAVPAMADNWRYRGYNIRTFGHYDYNAWRHGYWYHGSRGGRYAWWWYGGGIWYPYAAPVYPYPNPYIPPTVVVQAAPQPQPLPPQAQSWYYCPNPQGYYPYVPQCNVPWQAVPATPQ
jgi:hypothetical protein